jgi:shikimate kinase
MEITRGFREMDDLVISVGGGLVLCEENVSLLKENGKIVYLRASVQTLEERLASDAARPLLKTDKPLSTRLQELLELRAPIYEAVADFTIDTDGKTVEEIVDEIWSIIGGNK